MSNSGLVVVIPTRNRADLARNALDSVLSQSGCEVQVLLSDNSTTSDGRMGLSSYCRQRRDRRLRYVTPPESLPMAKHWDWALAQALSLYDSSHFAFLTDRMMFKPGALKPLIEIITSYPDKILTYMHDMVDDFCRPVVVRQYTWTGSLYEISSTRLLEMSAQSVMYDTALPRMLNCIAPRDALNAIQVRFGNTFSSIAPDWNFCYRALEVVDSILFYDTAALVHYAQNRSTGQGVEHGVANEAYADFISDLNGAAPTGFAPFPEIRTVWNWIISEYCHTKKITKSPKFPELDLDKYAHALALGIEEIHGPQLRQHMRELLFARGWKPADVSSRLSPPSPSVVENADRRPTEDQATQIEDFSVNAIEFQTPVDALEYALRCPRARAAASHHEAMIKGVALPLPLGPWR